MKRIVICCDGTWQRPGQSLRGEESPTNVARLAASVAKRDAAGVSQITYYDQGVGTGNIADVLSGGAFGIGLDQNIIEAYRFLASNYETGDQLYLFGFSRGAYTVRSLSGLIRRCGIVRRDRMLHESKAIELYRRPVDDVDTDAESKAFREGNAVDGDEPVPIQCIGVWDTVGALGIPGALGIRGAVSKRYRFHNTTLSPHVKHAFHALSVDERRNAFQPTLWERPSTPRPTLEQVWFCGTHSDVGGGLATKNGLAAVTLEWMIGRAERAGLTFDEAAVETFLPAPDVTARFNTVESSPLWRGLGTNVRELGYVRDAQTKQSVRDPTQSVHASVRERVRRVPTYRPKNLLAFDEREAEQPAAAPSSTQRRSQARDEPPPAATGRSPARPRGRLAGRGRSRRAEP